MDRSLTLRRIVEDYAIPTINGDTPYVIADEQQHHYLLVFIGWEGVQQEYHVVLHLQLRGDTVWVHRDRTSEDVTQDLIATGIPTNQIVLGYRPTETRSLAGFAAG